MLPIDVLGKFASSKGDAVAIEFEGGTTTWLGLHNSVAAKVVFLARRFQGHPPRHACYLSENGPDLVAWLGAFATLGITPLGLDHTADPQAVASTIERVRPGFLLFSSHLQGRAVVARDWPVEPVTFDPYVLDDGEEHPFSGDIHFEKLPFQAVSVTSGTTGMPKLAVRHESFDRRRFAYFSERFRLDSRDRFLACIPIHHAAGNGWIRFFLSLGATVLLTDRSDGEALADAVLNHGVSATVLTPILLDRIVDAMHLRGKAGRPESLRWVLVGGKNFTPHQKRRSIETLGVVHEYFGTTETGVNTLADPVDLLLHPRSVGRAFEGNAVAIVDSEGREVGPGVAGAVAVSSYMNMAGYDNVPANETVIAGKRYLITPDQGVLDREGRLYLHNRLSRPDASVDLYGLEDEIRRAFKVRDVILHQARTHAAVEVSCALVPAGPGDGVEEEVRALVERRGLRLTFFSAVDHIPYSPTGKVRVEFIEKVLAAKGGAS